MRPLTSSPSGIVATCFSSSTARLAARTDTANDKVGIRVRGHGRQKGHKEVYRGMEYQVDLLPKVKIEMVVADERSSEVIQTVVRSARTGKIGDGKVFVYDVAEAIRIRNDDRGDGAL
jgi:nitrogen regulatory protein P-II 1